MCRAAKNPRISVWGLTCCLTGLASRAIYSTSVIDMEFPPESYDVFDSDLFETARARLTGDAVMEVMLQMRPNGRCLDHYRIALDGTVLETQVNATSVFRSPVLAKYRLTYQAWPRDLKIRRNMTTTAWVDSYLAIAANNILVSTEEKGEAVPPEEIKNAFNNIKEMGLKSGSTRYAVVAGPDGRMWLEHQALPGTAEALTSKPTFAG